MSIGFHRPLTPEQRAAPFWMVDAPDDARDEATWQLAIDRVGQVAAHARAARARRRARDARADAPRLAPPACCASSRASARTTSASTRTSATSSACRTRSWRAGRTRCAAVLPHTTYWHVKNYTRLEHPASGSSSRSERARGGASSTTAWRSATRSTSGFAGPICIEHYGGDGLGAIARGRAYVEDVLRREVAALEEAPA